MHFIHKILFLGFSSLVMFLSFYPSTKLYAQEDAYIQTNEDAIFFYDLGMRYLKQKSFQPAIYNFKRALELDPDYQQALLGLSEALNGLDATAQEKAALEQAMKVDPNNIKSLLKNGYYFFEHNHLDSAKLYFRKAYDKEKNNQDCLYACGLVYFELARFDSAEYFLEYLNKEYPEYQDGIKLLAESYESQRKSQEAIHKYQELMQLAQQPAEVFSSLAELYITNVDYTRAQELLDEGLRYYPLSSEMMFTYGLLFEYQGDMVEANKKYKRAFNNDKSNRSAGIKVADAFYEEEDYKQAAQIYLNFSSSDSIGKILYLKAGEAFLRSEDTLNAQMMYEELIEKDMKNEECFSQLKMIYEHYATIEKLQVLEQRRKNTLGKN